MKEKELSFEEAMKRLDAICEELSREGVTLERALALYEEGVKLVKYCHDTLDKAEQRVRILIKNEEGEMGDAPFTPSEG